MFKQLFKTSIIALAQSFLLVIIGLTGMAILIQYAGGLQSLASFLKAHRSFFFLIHLLFNAALFFVWPFLVRNLAYRLNQTDLIVIKKATQARWYLVGILLVINILSIWR